MTELDLKLDRMYNYDDEFNKMMEEKLAKLAGNKKYANLFQVFRDNFLNFEKLVVFYQLNKNYGREHGETAFGEIKKFLVATGHIGSVSDLSDSHISTYLNKIRRERNVEKRGRKKKSLTTSVEAVQAENFDRRSIPSQAVGDGAVEVVDASSSHLKDWGDAEWLGDAPNWNELLTGKVRPAQGEWSDAWENVWRHLYEEANKHGLNDYEKTTLQGFKKCGADVGSLWLDLNKVRRGLKSQYGLNPEGVGKINNR